MPQTKSVKFGREPLDAAARRVQLAEAMLARSQQPHVPAPGGAVQAAYTPATALVDLANSLTSAWNLKRSNAAYERARQQKSEAVSGALKDFSGSVPDSEVGAALLSNMRRTPDDQLATPVTPRSEATRNLAAELGPNAQEALAAAMLGREMGDESVVVPYGGELRNRRTGALLADNERLPPGTGGGNSADMQWINRWLSANPGKNVNEAFAALDDFKTRGGGVVDAGGVGVGWVQTPTGPQRTGEITNVGEVASNVRTTKEAGAAGSKTGELKTEREFDRPAAQQRLDGALAKINLLIDKARAIETDPALQRATGMWAYLPSMWGGQAADVDAAIDSLKTQLGFNELQEMRNNSPTGGALGNVTEREGQWLQNAMQSLKQSQSREQYIANLREIVEYSQGIRQRLIRAFNETYPAAAAPSAARTVTRTGTANGRKVVQYSDGSVEYAD